MKEKNIFKLHKAFEMHENCSNCNLKYTMEPSFFYGAMYVNYGLTVGVGIITFTIATLIFHLSLLESFIPIVIMLFLTAPITIRLSRIVWINLFVKYNSKFSKTIKNEK